MARNATRKGKAVPASITKPMATSSTPVPDPFTVVTVADPLAKFLSSLPKDHVYLTTRDGHSPSWKRSAFMIPLVTNVAMFVALLYRAYTALPTYFEQLITIFGYDSAASVDTQSAGIIDLITLASSRMFLLMFDYALFSFLGSWVWDFVFGSEDSRYTGVLGWRIRLGFKEEEVVIRRGRRNWDKTLAALPKWTLDNELTLKHKIQPAMSKTMLAKTSLSMLDKDWDLDLTAMLKAHELVDTKELSFADFKDKAFVYYNNQWLVWEINKEKEYEPKTQKDKETLDRFRDKLRNMGHEDLFFRWIELVQYESSVPGGFTPGRQAAAMREARQMFQDKGVDFATFWEEVGGRAGMPGLD